MHVFVNEQYVFTRLLEKNEFDVTANSYVSVWAQDSVLTIDNVKVCKIGI